MAVQMSNFSSDTVSHDFMGQIQAFLEQDEDLSHEEEVTRAPYSLSPWWEYIKAKQNSPGKVRNVIYERAVKHLPGSYKLWRAYLLDRVRQVRKKCPTDPAYEVVNNTFDRALVYLHRMPRIWLDYCEFLMKQGLITKTRRTFDRALQSLPITQHERIWELYSKFVEQSGVWETAVRVFRRLMQFDGSRRESYIEYLLEIGNYDEAANQLSIIVNDEGFKSREGKTKHELWIKLCEVVSKHPHAIKSLNVEPIIRSGLRRFTDEVGKLWCYLADYYIRLGSFEKARDVYEEGIQTVITVRDFSTIFDAYAQFEETLLTAKMEAQGEDNGSTENGELDPNDYSVDQLNKLSAQGDDTNLRIERLELLMDRRPVLLNSVLLRQNPHNVHEWHNRAKIFINRNEAEKAISCYSEAVKTVDPWKAVGKPHTLWVAFAKYYEKHDDLESARVIFEKATAASFKTVDELANVYCEWAEMEIRHENYQKAREVMQAAVRPPAWARGSRKKTVGHGGKTPNSAADRLHKNTKVWGLFLDLEESLGTIESTKAAYEEAIDLQVATPKMILNYAAYLEEHKYYEDSFRAFEKGIDVFDYPHVQEIWLAYLKKFIERYGGKKLERARDLFEQAVEKAPSDYAKSLFLMYADMEENYGLIRHAMAVYARAVDAVDKKKDMYDVFLRWLEKAEEYYGVTSTRDIYQQAIDKLPDEQVVDMCMRFMKMERKLGEVDRARAILQYCSQLCDPRTHTQFWNEWHDFEVEYGNEETYRDMLRTKRTIQMQFSSVNFTAADMLVDMPSAPSDAAAEAEREASSFVPQASAGFVGKRQHEGDSMQRLEEQTAKIARKTGQSSEDQQSKEQEQAVEDENEIDVEEQAVPDAVFGASLGEEDSGKQKSSVRY